MTDQVHLVRHGDVENPHHVVYADLQEFGLSEAGAAQARETAVHLSNRPISAVYSSPLTRAVQTARAIAAPHGIETDVIDELTEFGLSVRWRGVPWVDLKERFPGEVEAYLDHPWDLPFSPESLEQMSARMATAIRGRRRAHPNGELVFVSHQDPLQAARLALTEQPIASFPEDKPRHAEAITLEPGAPWRELARWTPSVGSGPFPPRAGRP